MMESISAFNLFTLNNLILLLLFSVYEIGYKILVIDKMKWRVQKDIVKEKVDIMEATKAFYVEKLESYKAINNEHLERIKAINTNETETLKHKLNTLLSLQLQHKNEERQALINFLSNCNQWIFNLSRIKFENYGLQNIDDLKSKIGSIQDEYFLNIHAERIKILLFIIDNDVNDVTNQLVDRIEKYKIDMENILSELFKLLKEQYNSQYEYDDVFEDVGPAIVIAYGIENSGKINNLLIEFGNFNGNSFKSCMLQIENFAIVAKKYLTSLEFGK